MPIMLPPSAPIMISIKATDSASRIEISADASASPTHSAEVNQILSIISHAPVRACGTKPTRDRKRGGAIRAIKNRPRSTDRILPFHAHDPEKWEPLFGPDHAQSKCRYESSAVMGGFGGLHPHRDERYRR